MCTRFSAHVVRKIDEGVSSAIARAKPKRTCAGLRWFTRVSFGVEVAHNGVKMGFAISDEVIYVLISHYCLLLQQYGYLLEDKPELYLDDICY